MNKKFIRLITVICASLLMICAVCITAWADQVPATRTDLSPNEEETIVAESQEMIITKSLKMGASWEGKTNKNKPVILKLDLEKNQNVNLLIEGNHVQVKVQKSDRLEETVCKAATKPDTRQATLSWPGKTGSYLITVSPAENSLMIKAKLSFMDDEAFTAWKETQTAEEQPEEEQNGKEQTVEPTEETPAGEPEGEQAQEPTEDPEGTPKDNPTEDQPEQPAGSEEPITDAPKAEEPEAEEPTAEETEEAEKNNEPTEDELKEPTEEGTEPGTEPNEEGAEPGTEPEDGTEPETENKPESGDPEQEIEPKTEEEAEQPELPPDRSARITLTWDTDHPRLGDIGHFRSILIGYDDLTYTLQWQTSWDEKEWTDFEGATGPELDVELTRELDGIYFRLMVYVETEQE